MSVGLAEIVGLFLLVVGAGFCVAAAVSVSVPLGLLAAGGFLLLAGVLTVYVANAASAAQRSRQP